MRYDNEEDHMTASMTAGEQAITTNNSGLGPYTPGDFAALELGEFRSRFPTETATLEDEHIFNLVSWTEDDLPDEEWIQLFADAAAHLAG